MSQTKEAMDLVQLEYEYLCLKTRKQVIDQCKHIFQKAEHEMDRILAQARSNLSQQQRPLHMLGQQMEQQLQTFPVDILDQQQLQSVSADSVEPQQFQSLPVDILEQLQSLPVDILEQQQLQSLPVDNLEQQQRQSLPVDILEQLQSLPVDILEQQQLQPLPVDILEQLQSLPVDILEQLQSLPVDILEQLQSLPVDILEQQQLQPLPIAILEQQQLQSLPVDNLEEPVVLEAVGAEVSNEEIEGLEYVCVEKEKGEPRWMDRAWVLAKQRDQLEEIRADMLKRPRVEPPMSVIADWEQHMEQQKIIISNIVEQMQSIRLLLLEQHQQEVESTRSRSSSHSRHIRRLETILEAAESEGSLAEGIETRDEELETRDEELETRDEELETRDEELETRDEELETRDEEFETREEELETRDEGMKTWDEELETRDEELETRDEGMKTWDKGLEEKAPALPQPFVQQKVQYTPDGFENGVTGPLTAESGFAEPEHFKWDFDESPEKGDSGLKISSPTSGAVDQEKKNKLIEEVDGRADSPQTSKSSGLGDFSSDGDSSSRKTSTSTECNYDGVDGYSYAVGHSRHEFANPEKGPDTPVFVPTGLTSYFYVFQQQKTGLFAMQRIRDLGELLFLENKMYSFYKRVRKCPVLDPTQLVKNGFYAMYHTQMRRFVRIKVLETLREEDSLVCVPAICLIDYGKYETLEDDQQVRNIRPLKNRFLRLPMQGYTASLASIEEVLSTISSPDDQVYLGELLSRNYPACSDFQHLERKTVGAHVISCSKDTQTTLPNLKLIFTQRI